jgi:calcineurin-like phosphoesterase family protein
MPLPGVYKIFDHWCRQTVWIYSDPHFGDKELAEGIPGRPSDEKHIKLINSCVGRKDTLIILGDVGDIECARRLKGYKILICGNHDIGATNYERQIIHKKFDKDSYSRQEAIAEMKKLYPDCQVRISGEGYSFHPPFEYWTVEADNRLFDEVYSGPLMIGEKLILSHEPLDIPWAFNYHGHDHKGHERPHHKNCCSDVVGYKPIHLNSHLKSGPTSKVVSIHRDTIDKATKRSKKRKGKK